MQRNKIHKVTNIADAISNPSSGDIVFFDIDETLLITGFNKFSGDARLTEPELAAAILRLQSRGIRVVGLTARSSGLKIVTKEQLSKAGVNLDDIIHAPNIHGVHNVKRSTKGNALREYLNTINRPKRIFVFDDIYEQLADMEDQCSDLGIPLYLKHYVAPAFLNINTDTTANFPASLERYEIEQSLGGGTASVFSIKHHASEDRLVLKLGAHEDGAKLEMLCNAVYRVLGVNVPKMRVYHTLPKQLAAELDLRHPFRFAQVSEFIKSGKNCQPEIIKQAARDHFVAHALLGNIDVAKEDNFIVDGNNTAYLIDAGANFLFRSLGELRKESPAAVSELQTLRDKSFNDKGPVWFGDLTDDELRQQVIHILTKQQELTATVWSVSQHLQLSDELRDRFLQCLSDRLDTLVTRYLHQPQPHAKVDKRANAGKTSAGILTYAMKDGEPHILLSKRVRHEWWDNFGGKSDAGDESLLATARREVAEESGQLLNYTDLELLRSPFHDIVTGSEQQLYRMYISPYHCIDTSKLNDDEHTAHQWVPLKNIMSALAANQVVKFEDKDTVVVQAGGESIPLFPPLYVMLQQPPVLDNLNELLRSGSIKHSHTLSHDSTAQQDSPPVMYRPVITPAEKRQQIAETLEKKSRMIRELKHKPEAAAGSNQAREVFSQSEIHLKAMLGERYQPDNLAANVATFVNEHFYQSGDSERLIQQAVDLITRERKGGADNIYFYHACSNSIAFAYDVYTALYQALRQDAQWSAFRLDSEHFKRFLTINEFVAFYSENGKSDINNNAKYFNDCALSTNVFLFGNHNISTSCSISYLLDNDTRRELDLSVLFTQLLAPFHVSETEVKRLLQIFEQHCSAQGGTLYQIAMPNEQASLTSYPAGCLGVMNKLDGDHVVTSVINKLRETVSAATSLASDTTAYVGRLQARVMVPPHLPLTTHAVQWKQVTTETHSAYQSSLQQTVQALVHKILCHHAAMDKSHAEMPLIKVLPQVLRDNQLSYSTVAGEQVLVQAILAENIPVIRSILRQHPEFLNCKIEKPRDYINSRKKGQTIVTIAGMILKRPNIPLDVMFDFSDLSWLQQIHHSWLINYKNLRLLISRIPIEHRMSLLQLHLALVSDSRSHLMKIFIHLSDNDRLLFVSLYPDLLQQLGCVVEVSKLLPPAHGLDYLLHNMANAKDLVYLLLQLPPANRYYQAMQSSHLLTNVWDLRDVIAVLMQAEQLHFAIQHKNLVDGASDICSLLVFLAEPERIAYVRTFREHIKDASCLTDVLWNIPDRDRLACATEHMDVIQNAADLYVVMRSFPTVQQKSEFMLANAHRIKPDDDIHGLINFLVLKHRLEFARSYRQNIRDAAGLYGIVSALQESDRMDYACQSTSLINNVSDLVSILSLLPKYSITEFALMHQDKIKNMHDLCEVLKGFPTSQTSYEFALTQQAKIHGSKLYKLARFLGHADYLKLEALLRENQQLQPAPGLGRNGLFAEGAARQEMINKGTDTLALMSQKSSK